MSFTTPEFLLLFAATCLLYFNLTRTGQNVVVLIAGLVFYAWWDWRFLFLIFATTAADYACALGIAGTTSVPRRKFFLTTAIVGVSVSSPSVLIERYRNAPKPPEAKAGKSPSPPESTIFFLLCAKRRGCSSPTRANPSGS